MPDRAPLAVEDVSVWLPADDDGTVIAPIVAVRQHNPKYCLTNDATGQRIIATRSTLLGRGPSPRTASITNAYIEDPTRTVSRRHALLTLDSDGMLWIKDLGSLNGTTLHNGERKIRLPARIPVPVSIPATIGLGDQCFRLTASDRIFQ